MINVQYNTLLLTNKVEVTRWPRINPVTPPRITMPSLYNLVKQKPINRPIKIQIVTTIQNIEFEGLELVFSMIQKVRTIPLVNTVKTVEMKIDILNKNRPNKAKNTPITIKIAMNTSENLIKN